MKNDKEGYEAIPKSPNGDVDMTKMRENILAEGNIRDDLIEQIFNTGTDPNIKEVETQVNMCWYSRTAILFVDVNGKVIGYNEICVSCWRNKVSPRALPIQDFCFGKYEKVKDIFIRAGIKHGLGDCGD